MSFAVEVPGAALPLNLQELGRALQAATSSTDHTQRQAATQQLQAWETHENFFPSLQTIFLDKSIPHEIRFLAIILLKNGVDKYWRQGLSGKTINAADKDLIRSRLLQGSIGEEDKALALHNALVVAKLVRIDFPVLGDKALSDLVDIIQSTRGGNQLHLGGALLVLLRIVKELATARLRNFQTALRANTPKLLHLVGEVYAERTAFWHAFLTKGQGDEDDADLAMSNSLVCLKILRRLLVVGFEAPHQDVSAQQFWSLSQSQFGQFLGHVSQDSPVPAPYQDMVGKHLMQFTKLHLEMCEGHPGSFALLPDSLPLVRAYWDLVASFADVFEKSGGIKQTAGAGPDAKSKVEGPLLERLALRGLLLLRGCVAIVWRAAQTFKYRSPEAKEEEARAKDLVKTGLLTDDFVLQVVNVVITKLFVFRQSDLDDWEEDPEEWEAQECDQGNAWQWQVRPCAERVLLDLLIHYRELLRPPLLAYFEVATRADSSLVTKEAVYTTMGCAAPVLNGSFDFGAFVDSTIVQDAQIQGPLAKLLRRRIAILLSQWASLESARKARPLMYQVFRHLLDRSDEANDEVVRITAARQLKVLADDFDFDAAAFATLAGDILFHLIGLLKEVSLDDTRVTILDTIRTVVARMDKHVSQFGDAIMATLPQIWESAGKGEYMIKQHILAISSALVTSMGAESTKYQGLLVPLIREILNPESPLHLPLIEDAVALWSALSTQTFPPVSPELLSLVEMALQLLDYDTEVSTESLTIVKNYIILAPEVILGDGLRRSVLAALVKLYGTKSQMRHRESTSCLDLIIRAAERLGGVQAVSVIVQDFFEIGFLPSVMESLHSMWAWNNLPRRPNAPRPNLSGDVETDYLWLLARVAYIDPELFVRILAMCEPTGAIKPVWDWLSTEWFQHADHANCVEQKLYCLALTRLCELPQPMQDLVLGKLQDYLSMWTSVLSTLKSYDDAEEEGSTKVDSGPPDMLLRTKFEAFEWDTPVDVCKRQIDEKDAVYTIYTFDFVKLRLQDLVQRAGGDERFRDEWLINVDKHVVKEFEQLMQPPS
ncbi:hypothetical protein VTK73DRAFT_5845 [Phialemonium thermophilum]|uniref:Importin N-terminal domain-containing protein n=1 Tax=Phialemonium thermophilum TaxID=223376 RepID=A0ABR3WLI8_9PEZI